MEVATPESVVVRVREEPHPVAKAQLRDDATRRHGLSRAIDQSARLARQPQLARSEDRLVVEPFTPVGAAQPSIYGIPYRDLAGLKRTVESGGDGRVSGVQDEGSALGSSRFIEIALQSLAGQGGLEGSRVTSRVREVVLVSHSAGLYTHPGKPPSASPRHGG